MCLPRAGRFRPRFSAPAALLGRPIPYNSQAGRKMQKARKSAAKPAPTRRPPPARPYRHSRESGNPAGRRPAQPAAALSSFPRKRESSGTPARPRRGPIVIPAKAGIQRIPSPSPPRPHRHSRESGNPAGRRPQPAVALSSFPRKRESSGTPARPRRGLIVIPAKAGIQRIPSPPPARPNRHSRESGNPAGRRPAPGAAYCPVYIRSRAPIRFPLTSPAPVLVWGLSGGNRQGGGKLRWISTAKPC